MLGSVGLVACVGDVLAVMVMLVWREWGSECDVGIDWEFVLAVMVCAEVE